MTFKPSRRAWTAGLLTLSTSPVIATAGRVEPTITAAGFTLNLVCLAAGFICAARVRTSPRPILWTVAAIVLTMAGAFGVLAGCDITRAIGGLAR